MELVSGRALSFRNNTDLQHPGGDEVMLEEAGT